MPPPPPGRYLAGNPKSTAIPFGKKVAHGLVPHPPGELGLLQKNDVYLPQRHLRRMQADEGDVGHSCA